jgi:hypothetical protein
MDERVGLRNRPYLRSPAKKRLREEYFGRADRLASLPRPVVARRLRGVGDGVLRRWRIDTARPLFAALFLLALTLRAMVPAGFMIGDAASGAPALILCPGFEATPPPHAMAMHGHVPAHHHDPATHREAPCPFGALAAPALPPAPPAFLPPPVEPQAVPVRAQLHTAFAPSLAAPPPPATGPPAFA